MKRLTTQDVSDHLPVAWRQFARLHAEDVVLPILRTVNDRAEAAEAAERARVKAEAERAVASRAHFPATFTKLKDGLKAINAFVGSAYVTADDPPFIGKASAAMTATGIFLISVTPPLPPFAVAPCPSGRSPHSDAPTARPARAARRVVHRDQPRS